MWTKQQVDTPSSISGTVLISTSTVTGYEFGSIVLSPFQPFMHEVPVAVIDHGVNVYQGTFDTTFASSFGHATRATALLSAQNYPAALDEAQQAVAINPNVLQAQMILADTLGALHQDQLSAAAYDRAFAIAQTMEPSAKSDWTKTINEKRKTLHL
jgi:tetratricopeptide (TPR) repeat protein